MDVLFFLRVAASQEGSGQWELFWNWRASQQTVLFLVILLLF